MKILIANLPGPKHGPALRTMEFVGRNDAVTTDFIVDGPFEWSQTVTDRVELVNERVEFDSQKGWLYHADRVTHGHRNGLNPISNAYEKASTLEPEACTEKQANLGDIARRYMTKAGGMFRLNETSYEVEEVLVDADECREHVATITVDGVKVYDRDVNYLDYFPESNGEAQESGGGIISGILEFISGGDNHAGA